MPGLLSLAAVASAFAIGGAAALAEGIYTCVDARGRRITSDRPILECIDREQKELTRAGTVKRVLKPSLTAEEAAAEEEREQKAQEEKVRAAEEKRRNRALLARYPDRATHDRERSQALEQVENVIAAAIKRSVDLEEERSKLGQQAEFFKSNPSKMPPTLKRQLEQNQQMIAAQKRFIQDQGEEKKRIDARFGTELAKLQQLWADQRQAGAAQPASAARR